MIPRVCAPLRGRSGSPSLGACRARRSCVAASGCLHRPRRWSRPALNFARAGRISARVSIGWTCRAGSVSASGGRRGKSRQGGTEMRPLLCGQAQDAYSYMRALVSSWPRARLAVLTGHGDDAVIFPGAVFGSRATAQSEGLRGS